MGNKNRRRASAFLIITLIFSGYIAYTVKNGYLQPIAENTVEIEVKGKINQLHLPFLESLTRHFLALVH